MYFIRIFLSTHTAYKGIPSHNLGIDVIYMDKYYRIFSNLNEYYCALNMA